MSVNPAQTYTIDIYRIGWVLGIGRTPHAAHRPAQRCQTGGLSRQSDPTERSSVTGTCAHPGDPNHLDERNLRRHLSRTRKGSRTTSSFVVRDDSRVAALIYQQPVLTYQAQNNYPNDHVTGKSTYDYTSYGPVTVTGFKSAAKVSFDRPYYDSGMAGSDFNSDTAEINFVRWMERSGYDVVYSTDVDTHANGNRLLNSSRVHLGGAP